MRRYCVECKELTEMRGAEFSPEFSVAYAFVASCLSCCRAYRTDKEEAVPFETDDGTPIYLTPPRKEDGRLAEELVM